MAGSPLIAQPVVQTSSVPTPAPGTPTWQDYARWMAANQDKVGTPTYKAMSNAFQQLRPADKDVASAGTAFHKSALGVAEDVAQLGADATGPTAATTTMGGKRPFTPTPGIEATSGAPGVSKWFQGGADSFKKANEAIPYKSMTRKDINGPLDAASYVLHKGAEAGPYLMAGAMAPEVALPAMGVMGAASANNSLRKIAPDMPVSSRMGLAVGGGTIQAALGTLGIGTIFKGMPAKTLENIGAQGVADYISKSGYGPAMAKRFLNVVGAMGTNAVTMPAIEGSTMATEALAGKKFAPGEVGERINESVASGAAMAAGASAAHEVPGAAFDTAKQATPTARGIRAIESNPVHAASDLRLGNAYRIEEADIKAADPKGKANPDEIVRNVWTRLKDAVKNPLKELRDQHQISEDVYRRLLSIQDRAAVSLKRLTASDLRSIDRDLAGLDPKYAETIKNGLIDLDSASYHFKIKNTRGPVEFVTRHAGPAAVTGALALTGHEGLAAATGVSSLLSSKAGDITGGVGRIVDRALGWNKPELIRRLPSLQKGATALGFEQGKDSYAPLDDLRANAEAGRVRANTPEANLAAQSRTLRAETRKANEVAEGGYDNLTYLKTGLRPDQVDRGLMILAARKQIPAQVLTQFYNNPRAMMRGGVGLQVHDALNRLVRSGDLTRDPEWKPSVPSVSPNAPTAGLNTNTGADPAIIYNPRAYDKVTGAAAKHADEVARSAPTLELQGAARQVERAVSKDEKAAVVDKALAADPARAEWINKILRPLVDYGNERGSNGSRSILRDEGGGLDIARLKELANKGKDALAKLWKDESGGVKLQPDELQPKSRLRIMDEQGNEVGRAAVHFNDQSGALRVDNIEHKNGTGSLGPGEVKSLLRQLKEQFPGMKTIEGLRVSGARWGQAADGKKGSTQASMGLGSFLRDEGGGGPLPFEGILKGGGVKRSRKEADEYKLGAGISKEAFDPHKAMPVDFLYKVADWMHNAQHDPHNPEVARAYNALANETKAQFEHLVKSKNVKFETWDVSKGEPYRNSAEMLKDVRDNGHLWFYKTTPETFGEKGQDNTGHPLLEKTAWSDQHGDPLVVNDLFRIIHDYYGHTQSGLQFGEAGEWKAFHEHARMFSNDAIPALAAETLAQNAWVNFGPHLRNEQGKVPGPGEPGYRGRPDRPFSAQKTTVVPMGLLRQDPEFKGAFGTGEDHAAIAKEALGSGQFKFSNSEKQISSVPVLHENATVPEEGLTARQMAEHLDNNFSEVYGEPKTAFTEENKRHVARMAVGEALHAIQKDGNAVNWYTGPLEDMIAMAGKVHPEILTDPYKRAKFLFSIAVTSNGMTVPDNVKFGDSIYARSKSEAKLKGTFPIEGKGTTAAAMRAHFKKWNQYEKEMGPEKFLDFLTSYHRVGDLKKAGHNVSGELVNTMVPGSIIFGPKIGGAFFQNLMGNLDPLTMDRWESRTWGRYVGDNVLTPSNKTQAKRFDRFRAALTPDIIEEHTGERRDPESLDNHELLDLAETIYNKDVHFAVDQSGKRPAANMKAQRLYESTIATNIQPKNGKHRAFKREAYGLALDDLAQLGIPLKNAQLQALLWYPEKELYKKYGVGNKRSDPTNYAEAFRNHAKERYGLTDADLDAAIQANPRRGGQAARSAGVLSVGGADGEGSASNAQAPAKGKEDSQAPF
jgi:hypothetical protein